MVLIQYSSCSLPFISLQAPKHRSTSVIARTKLLHLPTTLHSLRRLVASPKKPHAPLPRSTVVLCCAVHDCTAMYSGPGQYARPFARTCQFNICVSQHSRRTFQPGERLGTLSKRVYIHPSPPSYPFLFSLLSHTYLAANSDDQECRSSSGGSALHSAVVSRMNLLRGLLRCNFCYFKSNPSVSVLRDRDSFHQHSGFISGAVILEKDLQSYCLACASTC